MTNAPIDLEVKQVGKDLGAVYKSLDKLGRQTLRKQIRTAIGTATKPTRQAIQRAERQILPDAMSKYVKLPTQTLSVTASGVSLTWKQRRAKSDLQSLDRGRLRHPLFGNRHHWYNQAIKPGMWTDTIRQNVPITREQFVDIMKRFVEQEVQ